MCFSLKILIVRLVYRYETKWYIYVYTVIEFFFALIWSSTLICYVFNILESPKTEYFVSFSTECPENVYHEIINLCQENNTSPQHNPRNLTPWHKARLIRAVYMRFPPFHQHVNTETEFHQTRQRSPTLESSRFMCMCAVSLQKCKLPDFTRRPFASRFNKLCFF